MHFFLRFFCVVIIVATALYTYIQKQNELTELRIIVPKLQKKLKSARDENDRLSFEIEKFLHPLNLMALSQKPEFSHLKHPLAKDIIHIPPSQPEPTSK